MRVVGVDENGLGPILGPLVATAVTLEVPDSTARSRPRYDAARWRRLGRRLGVTDSKETSAFGRMGHTEAIALALLEHLYGHRPADVDELLGMLSLDGPGELRAPCPGGNAPRQCFSETVRLPVWEGDADEGRRVVGALLERGVLPVRARCALACPGVLNRERARGHSKVVVDLGLFERLLLDARTGADEPPLSLCGMVAGIRDYPRYAHYLTELRLRRRDRWRCVYDVERVGEVRFEVDADARHMPVAFASMLGKYVREVCMERLNRFYLHRRDDLSRASGYRDPVTRRLVDGTRPIRRRLRIADDCFQRRA
ncbi:MAG: hypothetical protein ACOCUS_04185 [Polyangiales bacterium]